MTDLRALTYIEIDLKYCENTYGTAPCTASVGVTGSQKCFNTRNQRADCQDPDNFVAGTKTLRFGQYDRPLPPNIACIPLLSSARVTNARVMPGETIGERATLSATFANAPHGDAGIDKYIVDRTYDPFNQGTFWGKFRARNTYLEARPIRIYRGYYGQTLAEMDCEHFVIETLQGPDASGNVTINAVDFMRLLNSEKAQAPTPNNGYTNASVSAGATSFTLLPTGIGDEEYPSSGDAVLGQEEVSFTRSGDVFTVSALAEDHDEGEVLQLVLDYTAQTADAIVDDLVVNYSPLDSSYTNPTAWAEIVASFADVLYTRRIPKPTPVVELLNELVEQAGLVIFGNTRTQKIEFDVLRPKPTTGLPLGPDVILRDSLKQIDQPKKRFSQVWVFYGKKNIFEDDEPTNYYSAVIFPVADSQYDTPSIKKIFSKWIPSTARSVATDVAARAIARYKFPPRKLMFSLFAQNTRNLGEVIQITDPAFETATGEQDTINAIITGWTPSTEKHDYEAEEYSIDADSFEGDKVIQFDHDVYNIDLRAEYDALYASVDESPGAPAIIFIVNAGVVVGSTTTGGYAMSSGTWPSGVEPTVIIRAGGYVVGRGGDGAVFGGEDGFDGGPALRVTSAISVNNLGTIGGGGGGGGHGQSTGTGLVYTYPGGGGAGRVAGRGGGTSFDPEFNDVAGDGSITTGGAGANNIGGAGGDLGEDGESGGEAVGTAGGAAGTAVNGESLITYINVGTILGARIG